MFYQIPVKFIIDCIKKSRSCDVFRVAETLEITVDKVLTMPKKVMSDKSKADSDRRKNVTMDQSPSPSCSSSPGISRMLKRNLNFDLSGTGTFKV